MNADDIRRFVERDRESVRLSKLEFWRERPRGGAALSSLEAGHELYEHARAVLPDFPSAKYLADDLDHHVRLKGVLDRASQALAVRKRSR